SPAILSLMTLCSAVFVFFFKPTATTEFSTLSLHDALPISVLGIGPEPQLPQLSELVPVGGEDEVARVADVVEEDGERALRRLARSEEHTSELQSRENLVCHLLLEKKKKKNYKSRRPTPTSR